MEIVDIPGYAAAYVGSTLAWEGMTNAHGKVSQTTLSSRDRYLIVQMDKPWPAGVKAEDVRIESINGVVKDYPRITRVTDWGYSRLLTFIAEAGFGVSAPIGAPVIIKY